MLFDTLTLVTDPEPRSASLNMAWDEILLQEHPLPVLRLYGWLSPAVSIGYFDRWEPVARAYPRRELVRRWTGGGVVLHGEDWTYSLIVPRAFPFVRIRPVVSYRLLHERLAELMAAFLPSSGSVRLSPVAGSKVSTACFENAAQDDLLLAGRKIAGAAQRRSRAGLLHQGSLLGVDLPADFGVRLAASLAREVVPCDEEGLAALAPKVHALAGEKYASPLWNYRY